MSASTCMICFAENVKMFDIVDTHLQSVYEKLTNSKIQNDNLHLCFICQTRLLQCHQLFELAIKLSNNPQDDGNMVQHKSSTTNVVHISVPYNMAIKKKPNIEQEKVIKEEPDVKKEPDIKEEPDIKQKLDILQENVNNQARSHNKIIQSFTKAVNVRISKENPKKTLRCLKKKIRKQKVPKVTLDIHDEASKESSKSRRTEDISDKEKNEYEKKRIRPRNYCFYCEKFVLNFARHVIRNHYMEPEVQKALSMPKSSKSRKQILTSLRKKGNYITNTQNSTFKPMKNSKYNISNDYLPCTKCLGFYSRKQLWKHRKLCGNTKVTSNVQADAQNVLLRNIKVTLDIHDKASEESSKSRRNEDLSDEEKKENEKRRIRPRNYCFYCEKIVLNFARHVIRNHYMEAEVQRALSMPKSSKSRKQIFTSLRKKGNYISNTQKSTFKPMKNSKYNISNDYLPCTKCLGFYSRKQLWKHKKLCSKTNVTSNVQANAQNVLLRNIKVSQQLKDGVSDDTNE